MRRLCLYDLIGKMLNHLNRYYPSSQEDVHYVFVNLCVYTWLRPVLAPLDCLVGPILSILS